MPITDQLISSLIEASCLLDSDLGFDSGDRDYCAYLFVDKNEWTVLLKEDDESRIVYDSEMFSIATSPNWEYNIILNKNYQYNF